MSLKKGHTFKGQETICQSCGRTLKTLAGLRGHLQFTGCGQVPGAGAGEVASAPASAPAATSTVKALKEDVERMELEAKRRRLRAEIPDQPHQPDIMEQSGLGPLTGEAQQTAQRRAMGVDGSKDGANFIEAILKNPDALKVALDGLKGILGVGGQVGSQFDVLKELGINLSELWTKANAPTAPAGFKIGSVSLEGAQMTPELFSTIVNYEREKEQREADAAKNDLMITGLRELALAIAGSPENFSKIKDSAMAPFAGRGNGGGNGPLAAELPEVITCTTCGTETPIPGDVQAGQVVHCSNAECIQTFTASDDESQVKTQGPRRQAKVTGPAPVTMECGDCGQIIDVTGRQLLEKVVCPVCETEMKIFDPDQPIPALDIQPQTEVADPPGGRFRAGKFN